MHRARLIAILFVVFLCTLAPQWMALIRGASFNLKPLHLGAAAFVIAFTMLAPGLHLALRYARGLRLFYGLATFYLVFVTLPHAFGPAPHFSLRELIRLVVYGGVSLWVGGLFLSVEDQRIQRVLVWSCPWVLLTFVLTIGISLATQGIDPLGAMLASIKQADPNIIMWRIYRSAFVLEPGEGFTAAANLRHGIMSTVLAGALVTLVCRPRTGASRSALGSLVIQVSVVLSFAIVIMSLSRSAILMCVLIGITWAVVFLARERVTLKGVYLVIMAPLVLLVLALSPIGDLMYVNAFERTYSYSSRLDSISAAISLGGQNLLTGTTQSTGDYNAHNLLLDALVGGGLPGAAAAVLMLLAVILVWLRTLVRLLQRDGWLLAVRGEFVLSMGVIPLVRFMTAARGTLHLAEWVALGAFMGVALANEAAHRESRSRIPARVPATARSAA